MVEPVVTVRLAAQVVPVLPMVLTESVVQVEQAVQLRRVRMARRVLQVANPEMRRW